MAISTVGFVAGLDIGYGNVKGVGGSFDDSDVSEFILPSGAAPISAMLKRGLDPDLKGGEVVTVDGVEWVTGVDQLLIQGGVKQTHSVYFRGYLAVASIQKPMLRNPRLPLKGQKYG